MLSPSIVDETFCRTVNEAMMNNIPIITSGQGNLKYLVENGADVNKNDIIDKAVKFGKIDVVNYLISRGVDFSRFNN